MGVRKVKQIEENKNDNADGNGEGISIKSCVFTVITHLPRDTTNNHHKKKEKEANEEDDGGGKEISSK